MIAIVFVVPWSPLPVLSPMRHEGGKPARNRLSPTLSSISHAVS